MSNPEEAGVVAELIDRCPEHGTRTETWPECRCAAARAAAALLAKAPAGSGRADTTTLRGRIASAIDDVTGGTCPTDIVDAVLAVVQPEIDAASGDKAAGQRAIRKLMRSGRKAVRRAEQAVAALREEEERQERYEDDTVGRFNEQATALARRVGEAESALGEARATNRRLNYRAQTAESRLNTVTTAVAEWQVGENGTYVPLRTLAAIAKAVGIDHDTSRWQMHYERVEALEAALAEARRTAETLAVTRAEARSLRDHLDGILGEAR